jgi:putative phosphoribosyl transferase
LFRNRRDAGQQLARRLSSFANRSDVVVLALPRGGVPVAAEVAAALRAPVDVFLVRKLGVPFHEELAMGAVAEGGVRVLNDELISDLDISSLDVERTTTREQVELERRVRAFRGARELPRVTDRIVILIDDGLATGSSMEAGVQAIRASHPARVIVAVPVGARETVGRLQKVADEVVTVTVPEPFQAVGLWYDDFRQLTDEDVLSIIPAG